jgi:hypothetical protein
MSYWRIKQKLDALLEIVEEEGIAPEHVREIRNADLGEPSDIAKNARNGKPPREGLPDRSKGGN